MISHKVAFSWRPELASTLLDAANQDAQLHTLEIIPENYYKAKKSVLDSLVLLSQHFEMSIHGVSLGLCAAESVDPKRIVQLKRFCQQLKTNVWSEHLAYVRAANIEIGHLCAPPRTKESVIFSIENIKRASDLMGSAPCLENIATLFDPPCSQLSEEDWISEIIEGSEAFFLLDLHNIYANCLNQNKDIEKTILKLPLHRVKQIHLSGGHFIKDEVSGTRKLLDDHRHDPPEALYLLLSLVLKQVSSPVTIIIERDGNYPEPEHLYQQIRRLHSIIKDLNTSFPEKLNHLEFMNDNPA